MADKAHSLPFVGKHVAAGLEKLIVEKPSKPIVTDLGAMALVSSHESKKTSIQAKQSDDLKKSVDEGTKATKDSTTKSEGALTAITAIGNRDQGKGVGSVEGQQIPDELDNYVMNVKNYGGDFD